MKAQNLYIDVQFDGIKRTVHILNSQPLVERYERVIELPATSANGVIYEAILYVDGIEMDERDAKNLVVEILESPIWRTKVLGKVHPMKHDNFWNVIFLVDNIHAPHYAVLNAKYENSSLEIQTDTNGQPAFLGIDRTVYPLNVAKKIYEAFDITFSEMKASNPEISRAYIGMKSTVDLKADLVAHSTATYLQRLHY